MMTPSRPDLASLQRFNESGCSYVLVLLGRTDGSAGANAPGTAWSGGLGGDEVARNARHSFSMLRSVRAHIETRARRLSILLWPEEPLDAAADGAYRAYAAEGWPLVRMHQRRRRCLLGCAARASRRRPWKRARSQITAQYFIDSSRPSPSSARARRARRRRSARRAPRAARRQLFAYGRTN